MTRNEDLRQRFERALMPNYGMPPLAVDHGSGCYVWDVDGVRYLDLLGGIAVSAIGHAHPALVQAVHHQVGRLAHISNFFLHEPAVALAERLLGLLGADGRVFFANSGTEANEAALKLVLLRTKRSRRYLVAAAGSFHGRSLGSLSLTGNPTIRDPFGPYGVEVRFIRYGVVEALQEAVTADCAGVFLEPIQGEAGVVEPTDRYLLAAREVCDTHGAALVFDEVQSGVGRCGDWFAHQRSGVRPDVVTVAKGLGGGLPIGACIGLGDWGDVLGKGLHGSTFGGNPVSCAAALAVLDTIEQEGLLAQASKVGGAMRASLSQISNPLLGHVRGRGQWTGIVLSDTRAAQLEAAARAGGFLVNAVQPDVIRLSPPLILTEVEAQSFVDCMPSFLAAASMAEA